MFGLMIVVVNIAMDIPFSAYFKAVTKCSWPCALGIPGKRKEREKGRRKKEEEERGREFQKRGLL